MPRKYEMKNPRPTVHVKPRENGPVKEYGTNDVLSGRGRNISEHMGNVFFHEVVKSRRKDYHSKTKMEKAHIAAEIVRFIRSLDPPGRFLSEDTKDGYWYEIGDTRAIKKTSQALREGVREGDESRQTSAESQQHHVQAHTGSLAHLSVHDAAQQRPLAAPSIHAHNPFLYALGPAYAGGVQPFLMNLVGSAAPSPPFHVPSQINSNGLLPQVAQQQGMKLMVSSGDDVTAEQQNRSEDTCTNNVRLLRAQRSTGDNVAVEQENQSEVNGTTAGQFLFDALVDSIRESPGDGEPLTSEENQAAMSDIFGRMCAMDPQPKRIKRPTRDASGLDPEDMESLIEKMKLEIIRIPESERIALSKALQEAPLRELSFARIKLFLQREELDPKRAARRLVTYWEERRKWFGEEKFCLPLTLDGAMRDDKALLSNGCSQLLPRLDASGRLIVYNVLRHCGGEGYSSESWVRTGFYYHHLIAEHPNASEGYVRIVSGVGTTAWDLDGNVYRAYFHLIKNALPVSSRAMHMVCLPEEVSMIWKSAAPSFNKEFRSRLLIHDVPQSQVVETLAEYGISKDVLPVDLGGTCEFDLGDWLSDRRNFEREREQNEESGSSEPASRLNMLHALANAATDRIEAANAARQMEEEANAARHVEEEANDARRMEEEANAVRQIEAANAARQIEAANAARRMEVINAARQVEAANAACRMGEANAAHVVRVSDEAVFCRVLKRVGNSNMNVGFVKLQAAESLSFADVRMIIENELHSEIVAGWKFYVPSLGPISSRQEVSLGRMVSFLQSVYNDQLGNGSAGSPLQLFITNELTP